LYTIETEICFSSGPGTVTLLRPEDQLKKVRSVGRPVIGFDVKLLNTEGREVPVGEVGEIYFTGYAQMEEYYKMPEQTRSAFRGEYLSVGDLGRFDEDGFLYIVDRKTDMIISGGVNIYPVEIEDALHSHPKIRDVAVIGVPHEKWGEAVKAIVVVKEGETLTEPEVIAFCKGKMADYKKPKSVAFIDEMPRNPSGKILKRLLRAPYWEGRERRV
jgi:acyl-CoA synthetase (AMP-forming)/AMP-acid ligase II